MMTQVKNN